MVFCCGGHHAFDLEFGGRMWRTIDEGGDKPLTIHSVKTNRRKHGSQTINGASVGRTMLHEADAYNAPTQYYYFSGLWRPNPIPPDVLISFPRNHPAPNLVSKKINTALSSV